MAPTPHDISTTTTPRPRGGDRRLTPDPAFQIRNRARTHARITYAETPELYLREEMS
jgi:hypothetical protein